MLRRVQSTGDLHAYNAQASLRSPLHAVMEGGLPEGTQDDGIYRIGARLHAAVTPPACADACLCAAGKYTLEERRMRILRYRQKRHVRCRLRAPCVRLATDSPLLAQERNFERKIKYSCRKVLADSRPRVRGRFAKNDDNAAPKLDADDFDFMGASFALWISRHACALLTARHIHSATLQTTCWRTSTRATSRAASLSTQAARPRPAAAGGRSGSLRWRPSSPCEAGRGAAACS